MAGRRVLARAQRVQAAVDGRPARRRRRRRAAGSSPSPRRLEHRQRRARRPPRRGGRACWRRRRRSRRRRAARRRRRRRARRPNARRLTARAAAPISAASAGAARTPRGRRARTRSAARSASTTTSAVGVDVQSSARRAPGPSTRPGAADLDARGPSPTRRVVTRCERERRVAGSRGRQQRAPRAPQVVRTCSAAARRAGSARPRPSPRPELDRRDERRLPCGPVPAPRASRSARRPADSARARCPGAASGVAVSGARRALVAAAGRRRREGDDGDDEDGDAPADCGRAQRGGVVTVPQAVARGCAWK